MCDQYIPRTLCSPGVISCLLFPQDFFTITLSQWPCFLFSWENRSKHAEMLTSFFLRIDSSTCTPPPQHAAFSTDAMTGLKLSPPLRHWIQSLLPDSGTHLWPFSCLSDVTSLSPAGSFPSAQRYAIIFLNRMNKWKEGKEKRKKEMKSICVDFLSLLAHHLIALLVFIAELVGLYMHRFHFCAPYLVLEPLSPPLLYLTCCCQIG